MDTDSNDIHFREIQREYLDFLDDEGDQNLYATKIREMIDDGQTRLKVNINDLRRKNPKRAKELMTCSFEETIAFQRALKEYVSAAEATYSQQHDEFFVGLEGSFGAKHVTPRSLTSRFLGNMVCIEGIVTKCSLVRPKVVKSVHFCPATKKTIERKYTDMTSLEALPTSSAYPTQDEDGNPLETEYGLSAYKDHQTFSIQEMPENAPAGQLPRSVDVIADNDLVDQCKPGDRVQVVGMYRCLPSKKNGYTSGTFRTVMIANNIQQLNKEQAPVFSAQDIIKIKKFARQKNIDVFKALAKSLAPSIHGHEQIKEAVLCMLLGGTERVLENGTRIRGDINVLLIGDPSVAKSQVLRYVLHTAPRAIPTTGRGSSGVGLTAAVTTDQETGERRLEAGAMVLADRGVVCIDEFDKMTDQDRTAIHEVMEQGRVTIAKAGIHAKLNARCSVLAAANPVYGRYDQYKTPMENIGLQDSLLSRFDLLFVVLDKMDPDMDSAIADHVLRIHRYRAAGEQDGTALPMQIAAELLTTDDLDRDEEEEGETPIYEKHDNLLHGKNKKGARRDRIVSSQFVRKFIHLAREIQPKLTRDAADFISESYSSLRSHEQSDKARTQTVTARALETLIRLSTAHAKSRMSKSVELEDAQAAVDLEVEKRGKRKGSQEQEVDSDGEQVEVMPKKKRRHTPKESGDGGDESTVGLDASEATAAADSQNDVTEREEQAMDAQEEEVVVEKVDPARLKEFMSALLKLFADARAQSLELDHIVSKVTNFSKGQILGCLKTMEDENKIMLANNKVFLI